VNDHGYLRDDLDFQRVLLDCHLAFLPGPSEDDHFARYSIPSRTADFLTAGLPMLACVARQSATGQFLAPLVPNAVRLARSPEELVAGMRAFLHDEADWQSASDLARDFAARRLSMDAVRSVVLNELAGAAAAGAHSNVHCHA
jgi:hypothetical protein